MFKPGQLTRLRNEHARLLKLQQSSSMISISTHGEPPTRYEIRLTCEGLRWTPAGIERCSYHEFDLLIDSNFPAMPPQIVWRTPIFHPNIRPPNICIGDYWFAGSGIDEICVAVAEMVQYKTFNIYDPLNPEAAAWVSAMSGDGGVMPFPIDPRPFHDLDFEIQIDPQRPLGD